MINTKLIACLYVSIVAASAATVIRFDGCDNTPNNYLEFKAGTNSNEIKEVKFRENLFDVNEEVTLIIPAMVRGTQTVIKESAFKELMANYLELKLVFEATANIVGEVSNTTYVKLPNNCAELFAYSSAITKIDLRGADSSNVTTTQSMFQSCRRLSNLNFGNNFKTRNVTNMEYMFLDCSSLVSMDVSNFNTSNVTSMMQMFSDCTSLIQLDLTKFNTRNVENMCGMFWNCQSLSRLDLSKFETPNVKRMEFMFADCRSLLGGDLLHKFDMRRVQDTRSMFRNCTNLVSLSDNLLAKDKLNIQHIQHKEKMFDNCLNLTFDPTV